MSKEIKIGSEVKFLNDVGGGIVLEIFSNGTAGVEGEDGFDMKYNLTELMLVSDSITEQEEEYNNKLPDLAKIIAQDVNEERQKLIQKDFEIKYANVRATNQQRRGEHMVIDLHIHELIDDQSGLQDRTKLDIQLNHFERMMRIAGEQRIKRVIFIHGVGQGVLRNQIRTRLDSYYPDCTVRDANPREYGAGATEVILGQSSF
ncbi:MAG: Smr/MutS family protein [Flavobacteriales bacterium]|nr:Smr/MutS family protein [Flavobacteriales bacterium]